MFDFTITASAYTLSHHCRIWSPGGRGKTYAEQSGFRTYEQAERWATRTIDELERKAQEFADDPITRFYGL